MKTVQVLYVFFVIFILKSYMFVFVSLFSYENYTCFVLCLQFVTNYNLLNADLAMSPFRVGDVEPQPLDEVPSHKRQGLCRLYKIQGLQQRKQKVAEVFENRRQLDSM